LKCHSTTQPFSHLAIQLFSYSAIQSFSYSAIQPELSAKVLKTFSIQRTIIVETISLIMQAANAASQASATNRVAVNGGGGSFHSGPINGVGGSVGIGVPVYQTPSGNTTVSVGVSHSGAYYHGPTGSGYQAQGSGFGFGIHHRF